MTVQVNIAFKRFFLSPKNNKKEDKLCKKFLSTPNNRVQRCLYSLFRNQRPFFRVPPLYRKISETPGQDKKNSKLM